MQGKKVVFIVLFSLFVGIMAYDLGLFGGLSGQGPGSVGNQQRTPRLMLDFLDREKREYAGVKRDIFSLPRAKTTAAIKTPEPLPAEAEPIMPEAPPPTELQTFASQASYMGVISKQARKTVFINNGNEVLTVRKGDLISAKFRVLEITDNELLLKDDSTGEEASIPLQGGGRRD